MSRERGNKIVLDCPEVELSFQPGIKWNRTKKVFVIRVPDMYDVLRRRETKNVGCTDVEIAEEDIWRMINADRGTKYGFWFDFNDEQLDLDDDAYLGISYVQAKWYLSINSLNQARRVSKRCGYPQWVFLKKRTKRGGRPVGGGKSKGFASLPKSEQERLLSLSANYEKIVNNCYKKDWVTEYVELQRDLCLLKGTKFPGKKRIIAEFTAARQKWLEENT